MQGLKAEEVTTQENETYTWGGRYRGVEKVEENETYTSMVWNEDKDIDYRALASDLYIDDENQALELPADSPYGSALALPQIARSAKYNWLFMALGIRSFSVLYLALLVQLFLLVYIGEATQIMNPLGGQMHLCDFAKDLTKCPGGDHCRGPGGTDYTITRLYDFTQYSVQKFTKQALLDILPDKADVIKEKVDPGEWANQNHNCRFLCMFLFIISVVHEVLQCGSLLKLLWVLPTDPAQSQWIQKKDPEEGRTDVTYTVAGMPRGWKIFNLLFVLLPKMAIIHNVLNEGTILLMDTSDIIDMVLGAMSMSFVVEIPQLVFGILTKDAAKQILKELQGFAHMDETMKTPAGGETSKWKRFIFVMPWRALLVAFLMLIYIGKYYKNKCTWVNGEWVSKDMYQPLTSFYRVTDFFLDGLFHTVPRDNKPFWTMPKKGH